MTTQTNTMTPIQQQMAGYATHLRATTPSSSKGKPVTELCIFRLKPTYATSHPAASAVFKSEIWNNCLPGLPQAVGITRMSWGFALDDPGALVWMLDWARIEDHWDFWLAEGFPPVMAGIETLFEPGRPLVRHYDFGGRGMLSSRCEFARVAVWDDGERREEEVDAAATGEDKRDGYAVDVGETGWRCSMTGFASEGEALGAAEMEVGEGAVSHVFRLEYSE